MINSNQKYMVFDAESFGLHGPVFAIGYVIVNINGEELESGAARLSDERIEEYLRGNDNQWIRDNVLPTLNDIETQFENFTSLSDWFWEAWLKAKSQGIRLVSDVAWPVETGLLSSAVQTVLSQREWEGPYPLLDISSYLEALEEEPVKEFARLERELPIHHPLNDARQSARIFIGCKLKLHFALRFMEQAFKLDGNDHDEDLVYDYHMTPNEIEAMDNIAQLCKEYDIAFGRN